MIRLVAFSGLVMTDDSDMWILMKLEAALRVSVQRGVCIVVERGSKAEELATRLVDFYTFETPWLLNVSVVYTTTVKKEETETLQTPVKKEETETLPPSPQDPKVTIA